MNSYSEVLSSVEPRIRETEHEHPLGGGIEEPISSANGAAPDIRAAGVAIPKPNEVDAYLNAFPDVRILLSRMIVQARQTFGSKTELSLELYNDPEIMDHYLTLYVRQEPYSAQLLEQIDGLCRRFDDELANTSGFLLVTTDFRAPGWKDGV